MTGETPAKDTRKANAKTTDPGGKRKDKTEKKTKKKASEMTPEEKKERNRSKSAAQKARKVANKAKAAGGSDAEAPPPPAHPTKRDAKPARKVQVNNSIPQLCWYFQGRWNGGRVCDDFTDPKRGCKYTHRECYTAQEFKSLTIPPEIMKQINDNEKKCAAMGVDAPHRPPKPAYAGDGWSQSGDKGKARGWTPPPGGKSKGKGKEKGKGKKGDRKGEKGKGKGNRKGAANSWEEAYWDEDDWTNYQLQPDGNWLAKDWDNGWLGDDGHTWINPPSDADTDARSAAGPQGQMSTVRSPPPGAGSTLVRQGRSLTKKDIAPAANQVLDNNGQLIQLNANAEEFRWGVGVNPG